MKKIPRFVNETQQQYLLSSGDLHVCGFWVRAALTGVNGLACPADPTAKREPLR